MKEHYINIGNKQTESSKNPKHYKIDHELAEAIWVILFNERYFPLEAELRRAMINQGCQKILQEDDLLLFAFWKEYIEENDLACLEPEDSLH